jgi:hypothetical protein
MPREARREGEREGEVYVGPKHDSGINSQCRKFKLVKLAPARDQL